MPRRRFGSARADSGGRGKPRENMGRFPFGRAPFPALWYRWKDTRAQARREAVACSNGRTLGRWLDRTPARSSDGRTLGHRLRQPPARPDARPPDRTPERLIKKRSAAREMGHFGVLFAPFANELYLSHESAESVGQNNSIVVQYATRPRIRKMTGRGMYGIYL